MQRSLHWTIVGCLALCVHSPLVPDQGENPALQPFPLDGERVVLHVTMAATNVGGSTRDIGDTRSTTRNGGRAAVGVEVTRGLCGSYSGPLDPSREPSKWSWYGWEISATFVDTRTDRFTFDLEWSRWDRDAGGRRVASRGDTRRITLNEGDEHVLDFLEAAELDGAQHCNTNVVVRVGVTIEEDPQLADVELLYDLWFVERDADHVVETRQARILAQQGQRAKVEFTEIRHDLGRPSAGNPFVVAELSAGVLGRARRDGSIDLSVNAGRWFRVGYPSYPPVGGIGAGGRLYLNVQPGEVVELTMPTSSHSSSTNYRDPDTYVRTRDLAQEGRELLEDADWDGILATDDATMVHYGRYFEGREFSLMISAKIQHQ